MRGNGMSMTIHSERGSHRATLRITQAAIAVAMLFLAVTQGLAADAKPVSLNVIAHPVHQRAATGNAGNITAEWSKTSGVGVIWMTFDIGPLFERLTREATLTETTIDVAFLLNSQASPKLLSLLEPLDAYQAQNPIEDFPDIFKGMVDGVSYQGKLYAVPFRHAVSGLHYNEEFFKERGIANPPSTIEEFTEWAQKLTYTRADGTKVHGFVMTGNHYANIVDLARAWDGDFITADYRVVVNQKGMVTAIKAMREMYEAGAYPRNFSALKSDDIDTWLQTGRAAMSIATISKTRNYNDPKNSKFPGKLKVTNLPVSKELKQRYTVAPAKIEYWSMVIPKNSRNKQLAWTLIRAMSSKTNTLLTALNGNGPARNSTYERPEFVQQVPWAAIEQRVLKVARIPLPPFDGAAQAGDILLEGQQAAVLGMKTPQEAMDEVAKRVKPLLP
jgi:multiple sugar transport system substrate-binding protein